MTVSRDELEASLARLAADVRDPRAGLFGPSSKVWQVNREVAVFLGAGRAALLQTAHPFVATGVDQHSKTKTDPVGRFARTFEAVFAMVYGDMDHAFKAARTVHAIHRRIVGTIPERVGAFPAGSRYAANTDEALFWVHATLWDTSVQCFELIVRPLSNAEKDAYYAETKRFAALFGIPDAVIPPTWADFVEYNARAFEAPWLAVGREGADIVRFLLKPPTLALAPMWRTYGILTAGLLPPRVREMYELPFGRAERTVFDATLRSIRAGYPHLPPSIRYLPPYREAMDGLGEQRDTALGRALSRAYAAMSKRRARVHFTAARAEGTPAA
jgi:uncharacterized protein (DUF2236 family)